MMRDILEDFDGFPWRWVAIPAAIGVALIVLAIVHTENKKADCLSSGGRWQKVGESTIFVHTENVTYPMQVDEFGCVEN